MAGGVGGLVYSVRGAEAQPSYNLYNSPGDVVAQTNGTGAFTWQAAYEAFGTRTGESGLNRERHRANTKDEDPGGATRIPLGQSQSPRRDPERQCPRGGQLENGVCLRRSNP